MIHSCYFESSNVVYNIPGSILFFFQNFILYSNRDTYQEVFKACFPVRMEQASCLLCDQPTHPTADEIKFRMYSTPFAQPGSGEMGPGGDGGSPAVLFIWTQCTSWSFQKLREERSRGQGSQKLSFWSGRELAILMFYAHTLNLLPWSF